jgi:mannobiose 2-epimerase
MKPVVLLLAISVIMPAFTGCKKSETSTYLEIEVNSIENELDKLLQTWYPRIVDTVNGGYWTNFEFDWILSEEQDKMLVTQARGLWAASRAASVFPENEVYKKAADHGFRFLTTQLWDNEHGGFCQYYFVDSVNKTDNTYKLVYGNAFALYALSEYARINNDPAVLDWVRKTFYWLEEAAYDPVYQGYFSVVIPGLKSLPDNLAKAIIRRVNWTGPEAKDQNTSIHLLEALTAMYHVIPDTLAGKRLEEMLTLVRDTMTSREGYLHLFFDRSWEPVVNRDSSRYYILRQLETDHISFGHNIETAYLLADASEKLYGTADTATLRAAKKLIDHTLKWGFDRDYYGLFDKGYLFNNTRQVQVLDSTKTWWAQAEAWHALALFSMYYPAELAYRDAFGKMWNYINNEVIDRQYGGWYNSGLDISPENKTSRKAHQWKGCYHDGRALFQVLEYARHKPVNQENNK